MPEIIVNVKIVGGKKTPLKVWVTSKSGNPLKITFENGVVLSPNDFEIAIDKAVIDLILGK